MDVRRDYKGEENVRGQFIFGDRIQITLCCCLLAIRDIFSSNPNRYYSNMLILKLLCFATLLIIGYDFIGVFIQLVGKTIDVTSKAYSDHSTFVRSLSDELHKSRS